MKALNVMTAKELLDLQIDQMNLLLEELGLRKRVMDLDIKLGLCTESWYDRKSTMLNNKRAIYGDLLEDYQMTQIAIAALEQSDAEELHQLEESQRLLEVSAIAKVDTNNTALLGDDTPIDKELKAHESHEEIVDSTYEVVEEEEEELNTLDEKKPQAKKKP